jgi:nucleoside-diphosphate-sugar epimerase
MTKKTVFMTGGTGNMGWAGFRELYARKERFNIRLLARDSRKNRKLLFQYVQDPAVTVIWGDMMSYEDVLRGVTGSDYVLHVGGMVSPAADYYPEKTLKVNVTSAENVVKAVLAQPDPSGIKVVYIGSVAQYGDRNYPNHWGSADDPQMPAEYDMYALSKIRSEEIFANAGLKHWVSLRQSGILYPGILKVVNPTAFHVPMAGVLEWATIEDSGRLLAQVCEPWVPEEFWNRSYNISSGKEYRLTNYDFMKRMLGALGLPDPERVFEPKWFALKNFHGMWYKDADVLEEYLHFRANIPVDEYFASMKSRLPWYYSLAFLAPAWAVKMFMRPFAFEKELGTQWWVENDQEKFLAYYGSRQAYDSIRSWDDIRPAAYDVNPPDCPNI